jgi:hypothetical protein
MHDGSPRLMVAARASDEENLAKLDWKCDATHKPEHLELESHDCGGASNVNVGGSTTVRTGAAEGYARTIGLFFIASQTLDSNK